MQAVATPAFRRLCKTPYPSRSRADGTAISPDREPPGSSALAIAHSGQSNSSTGCAQSRTIQRSHPGVSGLGRCRSQLLCGGSESRWRYAVPRPSVARSPCTSRRQHRPARAAAASRQLRPPRDSCQGGSPARHSPRGVCARPAAYQPCGLLERSSSQSCSSSVLPTATLIQASSSIPCSFARCPFGFEWLQHVSASKEVWMNNAFGF